MLHVHITHVYALCARATGGQALIALQCELHHTPLLCHRQLPLTTQTRRGYKNSNPAARFAPETFHSNNAPENLPYDR